MEIRVSGKAISFPRQCVCCGRPDETDIDITHTRTSGKRVVKHDTRGWKAPHCNACVAHINANPEPWGCGAIFLVLVTFGLWLFVLAFVNAAARTRAQSMCSAECVSPKLSIAFLGWDGSVQAFDIQRTDYLIAFALENQKRIAHPSRELRELLEYATAERASRMPATAFVKAPSVNEDALLADMLAQVEKARGPAARRAALERALTSLTRQDLRERLMIEAAKVEVRAVLDKVDGLKSVAAKRRHLEEAIVAIRADRVPDEFQGAELATLEAAINELQ